MVKPGNSGTNRDEGEDGDPAEGGAGNLLSGLLDAGDGDETHEDVLPKGTSVGRYLVLERLGAGAMGIVYAAYDPELDRKVALKLLSRQPGRRGDKVRQQERLVREAKAIAKLSHPNVVGVFDVGVHEGQVFMAMEYLGGGTLRAWMTAKRRSWREIVRMFLEVGQGLAAAHAEGLIHRDFKPDNVLLDRQGKPKVADFGLVRLRAADGLEGDTAASGDVTITSEEEAQSQSLPVADTALAALTRTGAVAGTPAYMAPEQFLGKAIDARTDQFAFCVALYEALYGERPFAGETVLGLGGQVTKGQLRPAPRNVDVPSWIRACVVRGLQVAPAERYPGFEQLLAVLASDPIARRRRRLLAGTAALLVMGGVFAVRHLVVAKRHELEKQAGEHIRRADVLLAEAAAKRRESTELRRQAFAAFDGFERDKGETLWPQALAAAKAAETGYLRGVQRLEAAVALTPRRELRDRIADALVDYIEMDGRTTAEREMSLRQLEPFDEGGTRSRRLNAPATVLVETDPTGVVGRLETYDPVTHRSTDAVREVGRTPLQLMLEPGSYRLTFDATATHVGFHYPIVVTAGEKVTAKVRVPPRSAVPKDFVFVPEGRFLFGSGNEELRTAFLDTAPLHAVHTPAFLISRYETTIGEWIAFLETLAPAQRDIRRPQGRKDGNSSFIDVQKSATGPWAVVFRATDRTYRAGTGERFRYEDRTQRASQDWMRFPVAGISPEHAIEFAAWLDRSGRVAGARLCTEREWERVARGADTRDYPHGNRLLSEDANIDVTYGRKSGAYGPDEVGSHPPSVSPFGVHDLSGNVWEITTSALDAGQFVTRGGSFYQNSRTMLNPNRNPIGSGTRDPTIGVRICADARF